VTEMPYAPQKKVEKRYWALVLTRNGEDTIQSTVNSLMDQTVSPLSIRVVDDGSTDETPSVLMKLKQEYGEEFDFIYLPDRGYDIRRVVRNINVGIEKLRKENGIRPKYIMISGDDCFYPERYAEELINRMSKDERIVIASGEIQGVSKPDVTPRGSGRFIRTSFLDKIGGRFPPYYGYEGWILQKALQLGYFVKNYADLKFQHLRRLGDKHKFKDWGLAMKCLGYHPLEVLYRCIKYPLVDRRVSVGYLRVLWDYFIQPSVAKGDPYYNFFEEDLREYIREKQKSRMIEMITRFFPGASRNMTAITNKGGIEPKHEFDI
jgi:glycosyltransferase involved in cell wall biosynthesis